MDGSQATPGGSIQAAPVPPLLPPPGLLAKATEIGAAKANLPVSKIFVLSLLGGFFIAFGGALAISVGPACPGLASSNPGLLKILTGLVGLPFGLLLVMVCGAELFTGNIALVATAYFEGQATLKQLAKSWIVSYIGNFIGCSIIVAMISGAAIFPESAAGPLKLAGGKVSLTFKQAFLRAILANWFVCLATWMAIGANSLASKAVGIYLTISSFVAIGFEHSIANMFIIPMAMNLNAPITWNTFLTKNLIPVTLGNIVGGAVMVAAAYSYCYGKLGQPKKADYKI